MAKKSPTSLWKAAASVLMLPWTLADRRKQAARARLRAQPFPRKWDRILDKMVPLYRALPPELKPLLQGHIQVFLEEKTFEECGGMRITDGVRLIVAAQACLLILNRETDYYPHLSTILMYPEPFTVERADPVGAADVVEDEERAGESWDRDYLVLSWDDVDWSLRDPADGYNVVLHEFAHQLDDEAGIGDGIPRLEGYEEYQTWVRVLRREYAALRRRVDRGERTVMDEYGADDPSEFFAVATEAFFEKAKQMRKRHPKLYEELKKFYRLDPSQWVL